MSDDSKSMSFDSHDTVLEALRLGNHELLFALYTELTKTTTGNMIYSPFSIHVIMFMASVGADSKTFDEMIATIYLNKSNYSLEAYSDLLEDIANESDYIKLATGMFVDTSFDVKQSFVKCTTEYLYSAMEKLNFKNDPETQRQHINSWVLNKTNNKIEELFAKDSINKEIASVLANAIHFKCDWENKFSSVEDESFYLTPSNEVKVKMMNLKHEFLYYHDTELKCAVLEIPFKNHTFKMMILLPDAKDGLKDLEANFSKIQFNEILNNLNCYTVSVKLPRFKLEQSFELKDILSNLGCSTMFTQEANFSNIIDEGKLYVNSIVHKSFVEVDEEGSEDSTTGSLDIYRNFYTPTQEVLFYADHPFIMMILSHTGDVLFLGRLTNP